MVHSRAEHLQTDLDTRDRGPKACRVLSFEGVGWVCDVSATTCNVIENVRKVSKET